MPLDLLPFYAVSQIVPGYSLSHRHVQPWHYVKSDRIRSYSCPYFLALGLNTERYSASLRIQIECAKIWTRITPNTDSFYVVWFVHYPPEVNFMLVLTILNQFFNRISRPEVFCKKGVLRPGPATLLKKRLWYSCFPANFAIFLRTAFLTEHLRWLLLSYSL